MKFAICTDSRVDRDMLVMLLSRRLRELCADIDIRQFESAEHLIEAMSVGEYRVVFLDADMDRDGGLAAATRLRRRDRDCQLIIFAADTAHALKSYSVHPAGYVLKPVGYSELKRTLDWCRSSWSAGLRCVEVPVGRTTVSIPLTEIISAEISGRCLSIRTHGATLDVSMSMAEFQRRVGGEPFLRCHKSFIVNMYHIRGADAFGFQTDDGGSALISTERRRQLLEEYARFVTAQILT